MVSERSVTTSVWWIDRGSGDGQLESTARGAAVMGVIRPDRGGGEQQGGAWPLPGPEGPKSTGTARNHPKKGDDTRRRFEKAEPVKVSRGGSHGTGHSGAAAVTQ